MADDEKIKPDPEDYMDVEREYGPLPRNATIEERAHRYRLAQATTLIRLYDPKTSRPTDARL